MRTQDRMKMMQRNRTRKVVVALHKEYSKKENINNIKFKKMLYAHARDAEIEITIDGVTKKIKMRSSGVGRRLLGLRKKMIISRVTRQPFTEEMKDAVEAFFIKNADRLHEFQ